MLQQFQWCLLCFHCCGSNCGSGKGFLFLFESAFSQGCGFGLVLFGVSYLMLNKSINSFEFDACLVFLEMLLCWIVFGHVCL